MNKPTFYITTPLYYPSGKWHLGHSYTTVCCDAIARYKRLSGFDVFYLTGTDEHGGKIAERAAAENKTPKQFVDGLTGEIKTLWELLDISYDGFIRTTDEYHKKSVQKIFSDLLKSGDIYKGTYKGKYCTPCEAFWTDSQLKEGKCPDCGRDVADAEEECYFFRLSRYQDRLEKLLTETDFLQPAKRVHEMVNNFIRPGLADLAVSRTSVSWGIPVPNDEKHKIYVWIDALTNYTNALGYNGDEKNMRYWPADVHMVGKEIVRFHSIIWPAILMALNLPVPKRVYGHGWLLLGGDKMSKSKGNVADPFILADRYGIDALRYYLLREIPFGSDGIYTEESFLTRTNSDLVNDLGNLVKRSVAMANQYFGGKAAKAVPDERDKPLIEKLNTLKAKTDSAIDGLSCSKALEEIFAVISAANKYIDENTPWVLNKEGDKQRLNKVLYNLLEAIRITATLLMPFITRGSVRIFEMLGVPVPTDFKDAVFGRIKQYNTSKDQVLYSRLDINKELAYLEGFKSDSKKEEEKKVNEKKEESELINIDQFFKTKLVVAQIITAEKVEKADKLLKLTVDLGSQTRTVVSGIAQHYTPDSLIGKKVVLVANLKPVVLRGIESYGMILAASHGDKLVLVSPSSDIDNGSEVS